MPYHHSNIKKIREKPERNLNDPSAIINEAASLPSFEYDNVRKQKAAQLGIRVSTLDDEVEKLRTIQTTPKQQYLVLKELRPWDHPVEGKILITEIITALSKYIVATDDAIIVIAFWALHAHTFRSAIHSPRLNITAPEKGCGKTLVLDLLEHLTPKAVRTENMSTAVMFRLIDAHQPTLLVDEYDTFINKYEELRGAFNAGWQRSGNHLRCVGDQHAIKGFNTFAPVAMAGIRGLPTTLHDRSIVISMKRATKAEIHKTCNFDSRHTEHLDTLCRKAARWADDHMVALEHADPFMPDNFFNRIADRWRHLFAIADAIGGEWPEKLRSIAVRFEVHDSQESLGVMLLEDIRGIIGNQNYIASDSLAKALQHMEGRPWAEYGRQAKPISTNALARKLKPFDIGPVQIKSINCKGYRLESFADAFSRYLPDTTETSKPTQLNNEIGGFQPKHEPTLVSDVDPANQLNDDESFGVSVAADGIRTGSMPGDLIKSIIAANHREV